jgi:hypothetical protein
MHDASPNLRYYRPLVGRWAGDFDLTVRDRAALSRTSLLTRLVGLAARLSGRARMATTLAELAPDRFHHTTRVRSLGLALLRSDETITLDGDGRGFVIEGWQQLLWRREAYRGTGTITADAQGAHYALTWLGAPLDQTTRIEAGGLLLTQRTAWSWGRVLLVRQP